MVDRALSREELESLTARFLTGEVPRESVEREVRRALQAGVALEPPAKPPTVNVDDYVEPQSRSRFSLNAYTLHRHMKFAASAFPGKNVTVRFLARADGDQGVLLAYDNGPESPTGMIDFQQIFTQADFPKKAAD